MLAACHPTSHLLQTKPASPAAGTPRGDFREPVPSFGATATCRNLPHSLSTVPAPIPGGKPPPSISQQPGDGLCLSRCPDQPALG